MSERAPLAIDLFCGLGGWAEGLLSEGWHVIGFDIERHNYGTGAYPGQLVLQDVLTLRGWQFRSASLIVASPPCQAYSYRAMPWSRAKALPPPDNALFDACFRIQREACEAATCWTCCGKGSVLSSVAAENSSLGARIRATVERKTLECPSCGGSGGRYIPLIVENVRGAVKWVSQPVKWHFGSYYLWGDVPALMPITLRCAKTPQGNGSAPLWRDREISRLGHATPEEAAKLAAHVAERDGQKQPGRNFHAFENGLGSSPSFNGASHETRGVKVGDHGIPRVPGQLSPAWRAKKYLTNQRESEGVKVGGANLSKVGWTITAAKRIDKSKKPERFQNTAPRAHHSSYSRKAASATIAKIPFALAQHIARVFKRVGEHEFYQLNSVRKGGRGSPEPFVGVRR